MVHFNGALLSACSQKAHSSGEDDGECSEKDDAEGMFDACCYSVSVNVSF